MATRSKGWRVSRSFTTTGILYFPTSDERSESQRGVLMTLERCWIWAAKSRMRAFSARDFAPRHFSPILIVRRLRHDVRKLLLVDFSILVPVELVDHGL